MPQQKKPVWNNQNLFSNNYLEHRLLATPFLEDKEKEIDKVFEAVKNAYEKSKSLHLGPGKEASLEDKFVRPVLKLLGFEYDVQPITQRGVKKKRPDYALFKDYPSLEEACREKDNLKRFFSHPLTILEAKYWGRCLNDADQYDTLDLRDPTAQTVKYLDDVYHASDGRIQWAILTNGKQWRLFYYRAASRSGNFYEVDLEEIIQNNNLDNFKYFYLFFARDAFVPEPITGKTWLDQHLKGSEDYATRVSENLKELIFDHIFECLATGFIEYRRTELGVKKETDETLKDVFNGCLTLLYRLLFLLYAESRNLLPVNDQDRYYKKSLKKLKEDIAKDLETTGLEGMSHKAYDYWSRLESLCRIIDTGDKALNIPIYNGGLFETPKESFLTANRISDPFLAEAIELLTIDQEGEYTPGQKPFIDYSSLNVRHLGDIYEGLLEFYVRIAAEQMIEVKEKGKLLWKKASETDVGIKKSGKKQKGEIYIENSKHERKATGSYYTPHYVVEYIVKNTVDPVLNERLKKAREILSELETLYDKQRKQLKKPKDWKHWEHPGEPKGSHIDEIKKRELDIFETIFDIKVLDPAMGSGHFLVHTVDFITDRIITFLADYPENPVIRKIDKMKGEILEEIARQGVKIDEIRLTEVNLIKRTVMKRCIYGVDLNEMAVELAKLSLWLDSFTLGAPLSFLDHHLKCGNSLIGTNLETLENTAAKSRIFTVNLEPLNRAIGNMLFISNLSDATYQQVKDSKRKYGDADRNIGGYRIFLDTLVSQYFGIKDAEPFLLQYGPQINLDNLKKSIDSLHKKDKGTIDSIEKIAQEKRFFHWEIEFPEVFFERIGVLEQKVEKKENPGFDCVIGNPPYGILKEKNYFKEIFPATSQTLDAYSAFIEQSQTFLKIKGFNSFIVPVSWQTGSFYEFLRNLLLRNYNFKQIINLPFNVFKDAYIDTGIFIFEKSTLSSKKNNSVLVYEFPKNTKIENLSGIDYSKIDQCKWQTNQNQIILNVGYILLISKIGSGKVETLDTVTISARGVLAKSEHVTENRKEGWQPFFDGEMFRYEISSPNKFILYSDNLPEYPSSFDFFTGARILIRRLVNRQDRIMAHLAIETFVNKKDIYIFKLKNNLSPYYLLALLNSKLISFIYLSQDVIAKKDDFRQITLEGLRRLFIPRIYFTTQEKIRQQIAERFVFLYSSCEYDDIISCIETYLPEKSDIVHDLLAYLAEQMIELNKKKNDETKGFLKWLEREIGAEIDTLANKTAIKEYHGHDFNQLLEVLRKNKNKISIDPSDRKKQEMLERQFAESLSILEPLKTRIKATDELIDEIVYRLYGLTEEEIKVVKGVVS